MHSCICGSNIYDRKDEDAFSKVQRASLQNCPILSKHQDIFLQRHIFFSPCVWVLDKGHVEGEFNQSATEAKWPIVC